jgi:hypothetical protein
MRGVSFSSSALPLFVVPILNPNDAAVEHVLFTTLKTQLGLQHGAFRLFGVTLELTCHIQCGAANHFAARLSSNLTSHSILTSSHLSLPPVPYHSLKPLLS